MKPTLSSKTIKHSFLLATALVVAATCQFNNSAIAPQSNDNEPATRTYVIGRPLDKTAGQNANETALEILNTLNFMPRIIGIETYNYTVKYVFSNSNQIERSGGSIAWRNNNPGCIRYTPNTIRMGAIGAANGFAVFPDEQTGMRAIKTILLSDSYRNLNISDAITRYAPPHENDTESYIRKLCNMTGLPNTLIIADLNDEQMQRVIDTIRILEGWHEGVQTTFVTRRTINIQQIVAQYDRTRNMRIKSNKGKTL